MLNSISGLPRQAFHKSSLLLFSQKTNSLKKEPTFFPEDASKNKTIKTLQPRPIS